MSKAIGPGTIAAAIQAELTTYHEDVLARVNALSEKAAKDLAKKARDTAPAGPTGEFKKRIASKLVTKTSRGNIYALYARSPDHRIFHLVVHGHALSNGGRAKGNTFLQDAMNEVLPKYEEELEEALKG